MLVSQKHEIDKGGPGGQQSIALDGCMIAVTCEMMKPIPDKAPPPYGFFSINSNRHKTGSDSAIDPRYLPTYLPTLGAPVSEETWEKGMQMREVWMLQPKTFAQKKRPLRMGCEQAKAVRVGHVLDWGGFLLTDSSCTLSRRFRYLSLVLNGAVQSCPLHCFRSVLFDQWTLNLSGYDEKQGRGHRAPG